MRHTSKTKALFRAHVSAETHLTHTVAWQDGSGVLERASIDYDRHVVELWIRVPGEAFLQKIYFDQVSGCSCSGK